MRYLVFCTVFLCAIAVVPTASTAGDPVVDPGRLHGSDKLETLIDLVTERQKVMRSLRATFAQEKSSMLLAEASHASGVFNYLAPDQVLWDYREPDPMQVAIDEGLVTTYHPTLRRAEQIKVSRQHKTMLSVLSGQVSLDDMQSRFSITLVDSGGDQPYRLTLKPLRRVLKKRLDSIFVEVDRELLLPTVVEYFEADGDSTRFVFSGVEIDCDVDASIFKLEFGEDVVVDFIDTTSGEE